MKEQKDNKDGTKTNLHPRNKNREKYDLKGLVASVPELKKHIKLNQFGNESIDFSNPVAVRLLNKAILHFYYQIEYWEFPKQNLCPPIPGRAEYIHAIADVLKASNRGMLPKGNNITCLDIGTGASCIYPILGISAYDWKFIASDINQDSLTHARKNIESNHNLRGKVQFRFQEDVQNIFNGILTKEDTIDISICNPPFHSSIEEMTKGNKRKLSNLSGRKKGKTKLNFSGIDTELVYEGGEFEFIKKIIQESKYYGNSIHWFSSLVSRESNLKRLIRILNKEKPTKFSTINIKTGNKLSRILIWTFLSSKERDKWRTKRWNG